MKNYIKVTDNPDLVRDKKNNAILNTDKEALNKYKEERDFKLKQIKSLNDVEDLKSDMKQIKNLLKELLQKSD